jgi:polyisoprenoid-binding protein YceI
MTRNRLSTAFIVAAGLLLPTAAVAQTYDFGVDSKFVNIAFESRMDVEDILGVSHSITGTASLAPGAGSFDFKVPVDSLRTGIDLRDEHLRSEYWLDAKKYPAIAFKGSRIKSLGGDRYEVSGTFSLHGVGKPLTVTVEATRIGRELAVKAGMKEANWLRVRAEFEVKLSDFGVAIPDMAAAKVSDSWKVRLSLFAMETAK